MGKPVTTEGDFGLQSKFTQCTIFNPANPPTEAIRFLNWIRRANTDWNSIPARLNVIRIRSGFNQISTDSIAQFFVNRVLLLFG